MGVGIGLALSTEDDASLLSENNKAEDDKSEDKDDSKTFEEKLEEVHDKLPPGWTRKQNKKNKDTNNKQGERFIDPAKKGEENGVRVDKGDPNNSQTTQQKDHVVVRSKGKIIGRDGNSINGRISDNFEDVHIPLDEYLGWESWNKP